MRVAVFTAADKKLFHAVFAQYRWNGDFKDCSLSSFFDSLGSDVHPEATTRVGLSETDYIMLLATMDAASVGDVEPAASRDFAARLRQHMREFLGTPATMDLSAVDRIFCRRPKIVDIDEWQGSWEPPTYPRFTGEGSRTLIKRGEM